MTTRQDIEREIVRALRLRYRANDTFEVRALDVPGKGTVSGYYTYDDIPLCAEHIAKQLDGRAPAVYTTLNPVDPDLDLLARAARRLQDRAKTTTNDSEVCRRRWLPLDFDPKRAAGISSTDAEHAAALAKADEAVDLLAAFGFPEPVRADSGNGGHATYALDLSAQDDHLVERLLKAIANALDDPADKRPRVLVDTSVYNPARIWKVYGTQVRKGDNLPERPHRRAVLLSVPDQIQPVTRAQIESVISAFEPEPAAKPGSTQSGPRKSRIEDLGAYLAEHGVETAREKTAANGSRIFVLNRCVWDGNHTDHSAWVAQRSDGALAAGCQHNSCQGRGWRDFRAVVEPGWEANSKQTTSLGHQQSRQYERNESYEESPRGATADISASSTFIVPYPPAPQPDVWYGLAGRFVQAIQAETESDPMALLIQFLVAFGNAAGRHAHFRAEAERHHTNLFAVLVGESAKGRKGTSWGHVGRLFDDVDLLWRTEHVHGGLSSGEGLIHALRDPTPDELADPVLSQQLSPLQTDKRLLIREGEFASVLKMMVRDGNTLSAILRQAWDGDRLQVLTKMAPEKATNTHISIIGHITRDELLRHLSATEAGNGFGNRFLWVCVRRARLLPDGGDLARVDRALKDLRFEIATALTVAKQCAPELLTRNPEARELWHQAYEGLSAETPGLLGAMIARAEPQVMRLACIYALLDSSTIIRVEHLKAALGTPAHSMKAGRSPSSALPVAARRLCAGRVGAATRSWHGHTSGA